MADNTIEQWSQAKPLASRLVLGMATPAAFKFLRGADVALRDRYDPASHPWLCVPDDMNYTLYFSFVLTSLVVLAIPGPSFAYAMAVGIRAGRREIVGNALGMALGGLVIVVALALGVAHLVATSHAAFVVLKTFGGVYLVLLGLLSLRAQPHNETGKARLERGLCGTFFQGFLVETANPKAILFYIALVPQYVDSSLGNVQYQLLVLGTTFVLLQVCWDLSLMSVAHRLQGLVANFGRSSQRLMRRVSGTVFIALGLALLLEDRPSH
ncbi:LysE family translocator [Delftia acidovorans]|jgi:threonine/homoserine/homoserine lactone efflux protein|uniref:LysE family translocator n=1 Tax=Delftia acidovorans TaxID=80866 RepID=UPI00284AC843|nr:LysE family translocator [Delftia acidovorans]